MNNGASGRVEVCPVEDLQPGDRRLVEIEGSIAGVLNVDGELYAIENECPHQGGPVCQGKVQPELVAEYEAPGERVTERQGDRPVIACPWHGWEYDLATGDHLGVPDVGLTTFDVIVEDETVFLEP